MDIETYISNIDGVPTVTAKIRDLPRKAKSRLRKAIKTHAERVLQEAVQNAPEDTGALKKSGRVAPIESGPNKEYIYTEVTFGNDEVQYAAVQELGGEKKNGTKIPAQPYLYPAFFKFESEFKSTLEDALKDLS